METSTVANQCPVRTYAKPLMARDFMMGAWGLTLVFMVFLAFFAPRAAEARPGYLDAVILLSYPDSAQANICGNCHTNWTGNSKAFASRIDYYIYNGLTQSAISSTSPTYAMDSDNDGRTNMEEIQASRLAGTTRPAQFATGVSTGPNVANNWNWQIPDVDGDGCSHYFSRFTEAGVPASIEQPTSNVAAAAVVGTGSNYRRFNPRGWDVDDNDASQGCSDPWTSTTIAIAPGTTADNKAPGKVSTLSGAGLVAGAIPLKWVPTGDDGEGQTGTLGAVGGKAHSYEIRYTTSAFANGAAGRNPRSPADWETMHNVLEPAEIDGTGGTWNAGTGSLMQALYEPLPDVPPTNGTTIQTCNARNTTCTAGASYDIKARGTNTVVNTIGTLTYWVGMWTHDGVIRLGPTGTLTTPGPITEQATLSNIIAVTAGTAGAAISSYSPATIPGEQAGVAITVQGFGLTTAGNANQMVLTRIDGTVASTGTVAAATAVAPATTAVTGTFNTTGLAPGKYNLELRTSAAAMKAAWVEAITVSAAAPTLGSVSPNTRGQGAQGQTLTFTGTNFATPFSVIFSDAANVTVSGTPTVASSTSASAVVNVSSTASTAPGTVKVSANSVESNTVAFSVSAAPTHNCAPPGGTVGVAYSYSCTAAGGVPPYVWTVTGLPNGLTSSTGGTNNATLTISGTPTTAGAPVLGSIRVTDSNAGTSATATSIAIAKGSQTITLTCPASIPGGTSGTCTATSSVGLTVSLVSNTASVCTVGGSAPSYTVTGAAVTVNSTCTVTASQGGDANYNAATSVPRNITITAVNGVTHSCAPTLPGATFGVAYSYSCTASGAGTNPYVWTVTGLPAAGLTHSTGGTNNNTLTVSGTPTAATSLSLTIAVRDSAATPATFGPTNNTLVIAKANQTITLSCSPLSILIGGTSSCPATASSGLPVSLATTTPTICSVSGTATPYAVRGDAAGACTVQATQGGDANYNAAPSATQSITVNKLNQTITLTCSPLSVLVGGTSSCSATSDSGLAVSVASQTATVCSVTGTASPYTVTGNAPGACTIAANQAGNATYNPAPQATNSITVADASPNLQMNLVTKTATSVHVGAGFPVDNAVINPGGTSAGSSYVKFYLSLDSTITTADIVMTGYPRYVAALPAGAVSTTVSTTVTVPKTVNPGTYYVGACADATVRVAESNETDNCMAATGTTPVTINVIRQVDLVMSSVSTTTTSVSVGGAMPITSTELNQGATGMTVANNYVKFYLSLDATITPSDVAIPARRFVAALPAGAISDATTTVTVPKGMVPGVYYVGACADGTYRQVETDEANNCAPSATTVTITRNVDLVTDAVTTAATTASVASGVTVNVTLRNAGSTDMTVASSFTKVYLSLDNTITAGDIAMGTRLVPALAANTSTTVSIAVTVPKTMNPGIYYLGACADSSNRQPEVIETNNCLASTGTITITRDVDLVMNSVTKTATTVGAGEEFSIDSVEGNQGTTPMTVPSNYVKFYLSADAACTVSDIVMAGLRPVYALPAATSSSSATTVVTVPMTANPATYTVCACADATSRQPETNETNNCLGAGTISVIRQVDLVMTTVSTVSPTVAVGGSFTIENTERNQGTTTMTARSNVIKFYLSTDATITSSDKLLTGLRFVSPSLAAGTSSSGATTVTVPTTVAPGTYYIGAIADANNSQPEINELNNALAGMTITVTP